MENFRSAKWHHRGVVISQSIKTLSFDGLYCQLLQIRLETPRTLMLHSQHWWSPEKYAKSNHLSGIREQSPPLQTTLKSRNSAIVKSANNNPGDNNIMKCNPRDNKDPSTPSPLSSMAKTYTPRRIIDKWKCCCSVLMSGSVYDNAKLCCCWCFCFGVEVQSPSL